MEGERKGRKGGSRERGKERKESRMGSEYRLDVFFIDLGVVCVSLVRCSWVFGFFSSVIVFECFFCDLGVSLVFFR